MLLTAEIILLLLLAFAAASWTVWFFLSRREAARIPLLRRKNNRLEPHEMPRVTICVPARNEEDNIAECLRSVLAIDYPRFDVIVVDDRSTDRTPMILDELAASDPRLTVIHNTETPDGWTGKCYALYVAAARTEAPWLLFLDADTRHHPQCLRVCLREIHDYHVDVLTPVCGFDAPTFWEKILMPPCSMSLMNCVQGRHTNRPESPAGFLNGQFFLISREAYDAVGGHEAVRAHLLEDVAFARAIKKAGIPIRLAWGREILRVRMFTSLRKMLIGWSRIFFGVVGRKPARYATMCIGAIVRTLLPSFLLLLTPLLLLADRVHPLTWLDLSLALIAVFFSGLTMRTAAILSGVPGRFAVFRPLSSVLMLIILCRSLTMALGHTPVSWRGTRYPVREVRVSTPLAGEITSAD